MADSVAYDRIDLGANGTLFRCRVCIHSRPLKYQSLTAHTSSSTHKDNMKEWRLKQEKEKMEIERLSRLSAEELEKEVSDHEPHEEDLHDGDADDDGTEAGDHGLRVVDDMWLHDYSSIFKAPTDGSVGSDRGEGSILADRGEDDEVDDEVDPEAEDDTDGMESENISDKDQGEWYPFRDKNELVAMLLLGTTRDLLSRIQYTRVRVLIKALGVELPEHSALCKTRKRLKERLNLRVWNYTSPLGTPCFGLNIQDLISQDLSNGNVRPHLVFLPECNTTGPINRLSQSRKWLEGFAPNQRVPMVQSADHRQWYLYEPIQIKSSKKIYVPAFFYTIDGVIYSKCFTASTVFDKVSKKYSITIPCEESFDSKNLIKVPISDFSKSFSEIRIHDDPPLKDHCHDHMEQKYKDTVIKIPMVNPWRIQAQGRPIRHFPLIIYSDDTSGNVSKKWNKHMSFYCTAAGLPPQLTDQEYNIRFISTSNLASALELGIHLVDELNELGQKGFVTYDSQTCESVLVIPVVLAHLGDSPMHAEISNTMLPANSLSPCRTCDLKVDTKVQKLTSEYVSEFVGVKVDGAKRSREVRDWDTTIDRSKQLWKLAGDAPTLSAFDKHSTKWGIKDTLNINFVNRVLSFRRNSSHTPESVQGFVRELESMYGHNLFNPFLRLNGFNGHIDTPVETLHVILLGVVKYLTQDTMARLSDKDKTSIIARWQSFDSAGLNIAPIIPKTMVQFCGSLIGKEYQVVLQAAPFVFFEFLDAQQRTLWITLCHMTSRILQTEIPDMDSYLADLSIWIDIFLKETIKSTAQWTNKPKFHMLVHLCEAIRRYGPTILIATQRLEGNNGNLRNQSTHSNRQSPSHDIAESYNNHNLIRLLSSRSKFFDKGVNANMTASEKVIQLLSDPTIHRMLGYNVDWNKPPVMKLKKKGPRGPTPAEQIDPDGNINNPPDFLKNIPDREFKRVHGIQLKPHQDLFDGTFISVKKFETEDEPFIGCVKSMWYPKGVNVDQSKLLVTKCEVSPYMHVFYGMRMLSKIDVDIWVNPNDIECVLNVQHNCHDGKCLATNTHVQHVERTVSVVRGMEISHTSLNSFLINANALYSAEVHRRWGHLVPDKVTPEQWKEAIEIGLEKWKKVSELRQTAQAQTRKRKAHEASIGESQAN